MLRLVLSWPVSRKAEVKPGSYVIGNVFLSNTEDKSLGQDMAIWPVLWYQSCTPPSLLKPLHPQLATGQNNLNVLSLLDGCFLP